MAETTEPQPLSAGAKLILILTTSATDKKLYIYQYNKLAFRLDGKPITEIHGNYQLGAASFSI